MHIYLRYMHIIIRCHALRFKSRLLINNTNMHTQLPASWWSKPTTVFTPGAYSPIPLPSGWGRGTVLLVELQQKWTLVPRVEVRSGFPPVLEMVTQVARPGVKLGLGQNRETQMPSGTLFLEGDKAFWDSQHHHELEFGKEIRWPYNLFYEAFLSLTSELISVCHYGSTSLWH